MEMLFSWLQAGKLLVKNSNTVVVTNELINAEVSRFYCGGDLFPDQTKLFYLHC